MKTRSLKNIETKKRWWVIDGENLVLGRLASRVAMMLRGKHKAEFMPYDPNCGDCVIVTNADKIILTGRKYQQKTYYWHTGYPGGIKHRTAKQLLTGPHPERVLRKAVERMMNKGPLRRRVMENFFVYAAPEHPHQAQQPAPYSFGSVNRKNTVSIEG